MNLGDRQIEIITYVKDYLKKIEKEKIATSLSGLCYFPVWSETPGHAKLKLWINGKLYLFKFFYIFLKNILAIASHSKYSLHNETNSIEKYNKLILSWSSKENFKSDGSFQDKYFCQNSNHLQDSKWILISTDGYVPSKLNANIIIIKEEKTFFKYNFFFLIKNFISLIIEYKFSLRKIVHYFSFHSYFAKEISKIAIKEIKKNNFKIFLMPYEAQPFHQFTISEVKKINKKIMTIGYIHSMLPAVPCDFVYRFGSPDLLLVHGESQAEVLQFKLNWPKNKLYLIKSLRFHEDSERELSKKIYLPYIINNKKFILSNFEKLLKTSPINNFPKFEIQVHSTTINSKKHLILKNDLKRIMENYSDRFSDNCINPNISIFFDVTSSIFEALESGTKIIHICSDPLFQHFNEEIWSNLTNTKINDFVYSYNLVLKGKYINFGQQDNTLSNIIKSINLE